MVASIRAPRPDEKTIAWFVRNVGPRTHYLPNSIGGRGWKFSTESRKQDDWTLTVEDERHITYYLLVK